MNKLTFVSAADHELQLDEIPGTHRVIKLNITKDQNDFVWGGFSYWDEVLAVLEQRCGDSIATHTGYLFTGTGGMICIVFRNRVVTSDIWLI